MKRSFFLVLVSVLTLHLGLGCGADSGDGDGGNNGANNGAGNNGAGNNGAGNNGDTNNGDTNNGDTNNGDTNNGDTNNGDTNNGDTNNGDTNNGGADCSQVPTGQNIGQACQQQPPEFCGEGVCVGLSQDAPFTCANPCIPDECTDACGDGEVCIPIQDPQTGMVAEFGACVRPPEGSQGAYDPCGQEVGNCSAGNQCLILNAGDTTGLCLPECAGQGAACPAREGIAGQCVVQAQGAQQTFCALICDAAGDGTGQGCPEGMTCTVIGQNPAGLCIW